MRTVWAVVVGSLALVGLMVLAAIRVDRKAAPPPPPPTTLSYAQVMEARVRMMLRNEREDDEARMVVFQGELLTRRMRCDRIALPIMGNPGVWRVNCEPGYLYTLYYDGADPMVKLTTIVRD